MTVRWDGTRIVRAVLLAVVQITGTFRVGRSSNAPVWPGMGSGILLLPVSSDVNKELTWTGFLYYHVI